MKTRPLILDTDSRAAIAQVLSHAARHPVTLATLQSTRDGLSQPVGDSPAHVCIVPLGYRCVFSMEEQTAGICRHLSVSVPGDGLLPNHAAFEALCSEFGFQTPDSLPTTIYNEPISPGHHALNIIQRLSASPRNSCSTQQST